MASEQTKIEISIIDGATRALKSIAASAEDGKTTFTEFSSAIALVDRALGGIKAAANFAGDLLQPARDAETAIARIAAASGATASELETLRAKANEVAFQLRVPFDQVAAGAERLAREGASASEVIANIGPVTAFARAALIETKDAAGQLSDVLDTFGLGIAEIGTVGDTIIATAAAAGTSATALTEAISKVGPAASLAGLSVNQTAAYLGALAEKGIEGGRAAKQLETIFLQLQDPTSKAGEVIRGLGLDVNDLGPVFERLATDSTAAEAVLSTLGDKPRVALKALLAEGGGAVKELTEIINGSAGASAEAADKLGSTFDGAVARIVIALDEAKAAFFTPLLAPLSAEIDAVSAKIQAFSGTQDFKNLQTEIARFVAVAVTELNRIGSEFDATKAVASIKQFVAEASSALGSLSEIVGGLKIGFASIGVAFNALQTGAATVVSAVASTAEELQNLANKTGLAGDEGERYSEIFRGVAESSAEVAIENDKQRQSWENIIFPAAAAASAVSGVATGNLNAASAARENTAANAEAARVLPQVTELSQGLKNALNQTAEASAKTGAGIVEAVQKPVGPIEILRAKIRELNLALSKAFSEGADTTQIVADLNDAELELQKLTGSAKTAAGATEALGEKAIEAAPKVAALGDSARSTASSAKELSSSTDKTSDSLVNLSGAGQQAATVIEDVSDKFVQLLRQQQQSGASANLAISEGLRGALEAQQRQVGLALAGLGEYQSEVEIRIKALQSKFDLVGPGALRKLAEEQIADEKRRATELANTPPSVRFGAGGSGGGGPAPVFNITLQSLNPGDLSNSTISDLARRLTGPIRTFIQSGS